LDAAVQQSSERLVSLLQQLVRIRSVTGEEARIGAFVADFCRRTGFDVEVIEAEPGRPNVLATWDSGRPGAHLLLNDHLDTIPPGPLEYWKYPPFAAELHDGRVYGRGTIDTKSGLSTLLITGALFKELDIQIAGKLSLLFTCDEEVGGAKGIQHVAAIGKLQGDLALVAEPTTLQVEIATKGRLNVGITTRGVSTHGARPWLGHNAIEDMVDIITALRALDADLARRVDALLGRSSMNVGLIAGGTVPNMVPNRCDIEVDRRLIPGETPDGALREIEEIVRMVGKQNPKLQASVSRLLWWPGYAISANEAVVGHLTSAYQRITGKEAVVCGKDAGTDASWINTLAGIPVVMFSPGNGKEAMNANESVAVDDLLTAARVVASFAFDVLSPVSSRPSGHQ
jgi:acetylornithine deacetylase/succinyl-diaminopimelate desuccinylase family protein